MVSTPLDQSPPSPPPEPPASPQLGLLGVLGGLTVLAVGSGAIAMFGVAFGVATLFGAMGAALSG